DLALLEGVRATARCEARAWRCRADPRARHPDPLADGEGALVGQPVGAFHGVDGNPEALRDAPERVAGLDHVPASSARARLRRRPTAAGAEGCEQAEDERRSG